MADEATVGSIIGYLKLDNSDFIAKVEEAKRAIEDLQSNNPDIRIGVNGAAARAELDRLRADLDRLRDQHIDVRVNNAEAMAQIAALRAELDRLRASGGGGGAGGGAAGGINPLFAGIAAGATLVGPLVAAGTAGLIEFGAAAGTAALAYKGLQAQEQQGTAVGENLRANLGSIRGEFSKLETIAGNQASDGVLGALTKIKNYIPELDGPVAGLSEHLGGALNITATGLISGLRAANPLIQDAGTYAEELAQKFADFTASPEFQQFINYAQQELPQVGHDLEDVGTAFVHTAVALQPIGDGLLHVIDLAARAADELAKLGIHADKVLASSDTAPKSNDLSFGGILKGFVSGKTPGQQSPLNVLSRPTPTSQNSLLTAGAASSNAHEAMLAAQAVQQQQDALSAVERQYGITATAADKYTSVLGITSAQVKDDTVSLAGYTRVVAEVAGAEKNATASTSDYLTAVSTFAQSAGSASDRAALIGATLKAANGDALGYSASMVGAATANQQFVDDFDNARTAAGKAHTAFNGVTDGVVDLTTGTLNYKNSAAGPLIQGLQAMQTAATSAAGATYQHEVATKGATAASKAAVDVYRSQTSGALVAEAKQLGLTSGQAQALANKYFALPKDITTRIKAVGTDPVVTVLNQIGRQLSFLTGHKWAPTVGVNDEATSKIIGIKQLIGSLQDRTVTLTTVSTHANGTVSVSSAKASKQATGGFVVGPGTGTSDSVPFRNASTNTEDDLSNGEFISTAKSAAINAAALAAGNHGARLAVIGANAALAQHQSTGGVVGGGFVGVTTPTPKTSTAGRSSSTSKAKAKRAKAPKKVASVILPITISADNGHAGGFASYIKGQIPSAARAAQLLGEAVTDGFKLDGLTKKLAAARADLANLRQEQTQLSSGVTSTLAGAVDPSQYGNIGQLNDVYKNRTAVNNKFTSQEDKLSKEGLNKNLLAELVAKGDSAGLTALAGASKSQINQLNKNYTGFEASATRAGSVAGKDVFGDRIAKDTAQIVTYAQEVRAETKAMLHVVAQLATLTGRPVRLEVDGKNVATAEFVDKKLQGVMNDLTHQLTTLLG